MVIKGMFKISFEIGEENYERIGKISDDVLLESKKIINKNLTIENMEVKSDKKIGTAVEHHIFGRGIITSINEKTEIMALNLIN